jgi:hypothetical protein
MSSRLGAGGRTLRSDALPTGIDARAFEDVVHATAALVYQAPRVHPAARSSERYRLIRARSYALSKLYDAMFSVFDVVALVNGHDYNH